MFKNEDVNDDHLRSALREIREFAASSGLRWVLDEFDEQTVLGVVEPKALRESRRDGRVMYEEITEVPVKPSSGRPRSEEFVTRRPMSVREQVDTLIDALDRVLVGVERIAIESVVQLQAMPDVGQAEVYEIDFVPEVDDAAPQVTTEELRHDTRNARTEALLRRLREVMDE